MTWKVRTIIAGVTIALACAAPTPAPESGAAPAEGEAATTARRRSDVISQQELMASSATNLAEAIQQLRPRFLQRRGESSLNMTEGLGVVVYVDDSRAGSADVLRTLHPGEVREVRYLDGPQASARFGINHGGGAILVYRKRGG